MSRLPLVQSKDLLADSGTNLPPNECAPSEKLNIKKHVSFSELYSQETCPYKWYQEYILKNRAEATIFTIFGSAVGVSIEHNILKNNKLSWISLGKTLIKFIKTHSAPKEELEKKAFKDWCKKKALAVDESSYKLYCKETFLPAAFRIYKDIIPYFKNELKDWDVVSFEIPLLETIDGLDISFKGFIDVVLKHKIEDRFKILDFKTCGNGWDKETRSDTHKLYQVILYKKYWCEKNKVDPSKVECAYLLLKRRPPRNESSIEMFDITSGDKKLFNAEVWMLKTIRSILMEHKIKPSNACAFCNCGKKKRKYW